MVNKKFAAGVVHTQGARQIPIGEDCAHGLESKGGEDLQHVRRKAPTAIYGHSVPRGIQRQKVGTLRGHVPLVRC